MQVCCSKHLVHKHTWMCILQICNVYQKQLWNHSYRAGNWLCISIFGWVWSLLCAYVQVCSVFCQNLHVYFETNILSLVKLRVIDMATKQNKKCQNCRSWLFSRGDILVLVSSTLLYGIHWFVYDSIKLYLPDYLRVVLSILSWCCCQWQAGWVNHG